MSLRTYWNITCRDSRGNIKWHEELVGNILHDEGEEYILKAAFTEAESIPASFFIGLDDRVSLAEGDSLAPTGEPAVCGYARQPVASDATDWTAVQDSGDWQITSKTVSFNPSGADYPSVRNMFLATTVNNAGLIIASVALSGGRVVNDGDQLDTSIVIKLQ